MFITVCIEFKLDTSSRRPSHISVSVLAAGWARAPESAAVTEVSEAVTGVWAEVLSVWIFGVSVRLRGVVPSFPSPSQCPRQAVPLQEFLQVLQKAVQIELDSEEHRARVSSP